MKSRFLLIRVWCLVCGLTALTPSANAGTRFGALQLSRTGDSFELPIGFSSDENVTCVQFDITFDATALPLGAPVVGDAAATHRVDSTLAAPNRRRVVLYSTTLTSLSGGVVLRFPAAGATTSAPLPTISNVQLITKSGLPLAAVLSDLVPTSVAGLDGTSTPAGQPRTLSASVIPGPVDPAIKYQWLLNGQPIAGATNAQYRIAPFGSDNSGSYQVRITTSSGSILSAAVTFGTSDDFSRIVNVAVRSSAGTGDQTLTIGLVVTGSGSKEVVFRGIGPSLTQFGVPGVLADPQLKIFKGSVAMGQNDNWSGDASLAAKFVALGAFALPPDSKDAALSSNLAPGAYTAQISSAVGTGVVLIEAYDADTGKPSSRFVNVSARNQVGTGANVLIVGFNVTGNAPKKLLIRAVGPTLQSFGVGGVLANPKLQLYSASNSTAPVAENDDWGSTAELNDAITSVGAFPLTSQRDSALLVNLSPGSYTAQVSGVGGTTGVALVEVYEVP